MKLDELMRQVGEHGMPAVALTDHGSLFGAYEFYSAARKVGIKPVLGCEMYVAPGSRKERTGNPYGSRKPYHHLVLLAENQRGWDNLMHLVTTAYLDGFYHRPRIDKELLAAHADGLIGLSACLSGEVTAKVLSGDEKGARRPPRSTARFSAEDSSSRCRSMACGTAGCTAGDQRLSQRLESGRGHPRMPRPSSRGRRGASCPDRHRAKQDLTEMAHDMPYNDEFYVKSAAEMARLFGDQRSS